MQTGPGGFPTGPVQSFLVPASSRTLVADLHPRFSVSILGGGPVQDRGLRIGRGAGTISGGLSSIRNPPSQSFTRPLDGTDFRATFVCRPGLHQTLRELRACFVIETSRAARPEVTASSWSFILRLTKASSRAEPSSTRNRHGNITECCSGF